MTDTQTVDLDTGPPRPRRHGRGRAVRIVTLAVGVATAAVAVVASRSGDTHPPTRVVTVPALQAVSSAVGTTVAAERWDFTFADSFQPAPGNPPVADAAISGQGTVNLNPFAMVAFANNPSFGEVTTVMNGSLVWEFGAGNYGVSSGGASPTGAPIAGFAPLVESTR